MARPRQWERVLTSAGCRPDYQPGGCEKVGMYNKTHMFVCVCSVVRKYVSYYYVQSRIGRRLGFHLDRRKGAAKELSLRPGTGSVAWDPAAGWTSAPRGVLSPACVGVPAGIVVLPGESKGAGLTGTLDLAGIELGRGGPPVGPPCGGGPPVDPPCFCCATA